MNNRKRARTYGLRTPRPRRAVAVIAAAAAIAAGAVLLGEPPIQASAHVEASYAATTDDSAAIDRAAAGSWISVQRRALKEEAMRWLYVLAG